MTLFSENQLKLWCKLGSLLKRMPIVRWTQGCYWPNVIVVAGCSAASISTSIPPKSINSDTKLATMTSSSVFESELMTSSPLVDFDAELAKMSTSCMSFRDHEQLSGNIVRHGLARGFSRGLTIGAVEIIGLTELRAALKFAPPPRWKAYNATKPSESALVSAPSIEVYFDMKEPRSKLRSLDSLFFFEHNFTPAMAFLNDAHFRRIYAEELNAGVIDRQAVDRMIDEYLAVLRRVADAISRMLDRMDEGCLWE